MTRTHTRTVLVQARLPERLVREIDRLVEEGWYKSRTDALEDAVRRLLLRFRVADEIGRLTLYRLEGRLTDVDPLDIVVEDDVRSDLREVFGTDDVDQVMRIIRRR